MTNLINLLLKRKCKAEIFPLHENLQRLCIKKYY